jgi:uncharacterized protein (DUF1697 family)
MKDLVLILQRLGLQNIRTYIQSGNVLFQCEDGNTSQLADRMSAEIKKAHGFAPQVLLLEPKELSKAIAANPFAEAESDPKTLHVLFLMSATQAPDLKKLEQIKAASERFELKGRLFYLHAPDGVGRSKLAASAERLLGVPVTGRNWKTVQEIMALAKKAP